MKSNFFLFKMMIGVQLFIFNSCNSGIESNVNSIDTFVNSIDSNVFQIDSKKMNNINIDTISGKNFDDIDTSILFGDAPISTLPFSDNNNSKFYYLPKVKSSKYIFVNPGTDITICNHNIPIDSLFILNRFNYRLPDIGNFEVYLLKNRIEGIALDYTKAFRRYCESILIFNSYGYLIFYNKISHEANFILVSYHFYNDALCSRQFYIDKDFHIYIMDRMYSEGEDGADMEVTGQYEIRLTDHDKVEILNRADLDLKYFK